MAEFKIDGRMTVRKLKENFKNEFEGTLRVYDGRELADDKATLAAIRKGDAKGGEFICRASRTVGKFEQEMKEVFGIRVQVASPDDYVLALDGITLANLKNIKEKSTKADMEELVAYKRKDKSENAEKTPTVADEAKKEEKICIDKKYASYPIFDFKFKEIDWELNEENIEAHREEIDMYGVIYIRAYSEDGDFATKVISNCDIADGLYDAIDEVNDFNDEWDAVKVYYTTVCESYGAGETYERGDEFGNVLSSMLGCEDYWFDYDISKPVICRIECDGDDAWGHIWYTDEWGNYCEDIDVDIDLLIEFQKNPESVADRIEWLEEKMQCLNTNNELLFEFSATYVRGGKISPNNLIPIENYDKDGFINKKGEQVIPCKFDYAYDFSNGFAKVGMDGKCGYVNELGDEVIPCKFDNAGDFSSNGLAKVEMDGKWGVINTKGEYVIPCKFDYAYDFSNGLAIVKMDGKCGYVNEKGDEVIPCKFDRADNFSSNGFAIVEMDGKWGVINTKGEYVIPCKFDDAGDFSSNGLAKVEMDGKYGYINEQGDEVIPCKFDRADNFSSNGFAIVKMDGKYGYINEQGDEVIPCKFDDAYDFSSNGFAIVKMDGKYGYINEQGGEVIPCKFDIAGVFSSNGFAKVKIDNKYGYINEQGDEVIPCKFDDAGDFSSNGFAEVKMDGKYGVINTKGEYVIPCEYSQLTLYAEEGLILVKK